MSKAKTDGIKLIANNKKARHDYFVDDSFEAGIVLHGTEVKSLRQGHCSIKESFVDIDNGEVFIHQMHISPYEKGNIFNKDPLRTRKLLLHKSEISKMIGQINQKGYTLIPLKVYFSGSLVKVQIGLCKGKKLYDKRQDISKRDQLREAERLQSKKLWIISRKIKDCIRSYTKRLDILYKRLYNIISRLGRLSVSNQAY